MKNLQNLIRKYKKKTKRCVVKKGILFRIKYYLVLSGVKLQMVKPPNVGSPTLNQRNKSLAICRLFAQLKTKLTRKPFLSSHFLTHFVVLFADHPCFSFAGSLIIGLAIGSAVSRGSDVAVNFSGWSL